jgi:hypothetical protein
VQSIHGNPPRIFRRQVPSRDVGPVPEVSSHLQYAGLGQWTYAGVVVQRSMHRTDGSAEGVRYVTESSGRLAHFLGSNSCQPPAACLKQRGEGSQAAGTRKR